MANVFSVGIGAGLVSALLIAVVVKATAFALLLFLLAPIPILIVTLGWDHRSGVVAAAVGGLALALALSPLEGSSFALGTALPAWWLGYLALLGRPDAGGTMEWYPLGRLLAWIAAIAAFTVLGSVLTSFSDYETFQNRWRRAVELLLRRQTNTPEGSPLPDIGGVPASAIIAQAPTIAPIVAGQMLVLTLTFYLWAGAKIVAVSGRLPRPWPFIPATAMPRSTVVMLAAAIVMMNLDGFVRLFGLGVFGALLAAFSLQGLAALHQLTMGRAGRGALLWVAYLLIVFTQGLLLLPLTLFAVADSAFGIRRRLNLPSAPRNASGPPTPPPGPWSGRNP
jgi:hypothetical protein